MNTQRKIYQQAAQRSFGRACLVATFFSYVLWASAIVPAVTLIGMRFLNSIVKWPLLSKLVHQLPYETKISFSKVFEPGTLVIGLVLVLVTPLVASAFFGDFIEAQKRQIRSQLSLFVGFSLTLILMVLSFVDLVVEVMIAGQPIKPFPEDAVGPLQYLHALSFVPFCVLLALSIFALVEVSRRSWSRNPYQPLPRQPRLVEFPRRVGKQVHAKLAANS